MLILSEKFPQYNMNNLFKNNQKGFSVVEVLISLTMAGIIIVSVGNVMASTHKLDTASAMKEKASAYAKESMETINGMKNDAFSCVCDSDHCDSEDPRHCYRDVDHNCTLLNGYNSCWTEFPKYTRSNSPLHLEQISEKWQLVDGEETITSDPLFTRVIIIENLNGDTNRKKITTKVSWSEKGQPKNVSLSTILTAWEDLTP
jgi:type II secretory pathway component PulJ